MWRRLGLDSPRSTGPVHGAPAASPGLVPQVSLHKAAPADFSFSGSVLVMMEETSSRFFSLLSLPSLSLFLREDLQPPPFCQIPALGSRAEAQEVKPTQRGSEDPAWKGFQLL